VYTNDIFEVVLSILHLYLISNDQLRFDQCVSLSGILADGGTDCWAFDKLLYLSVKITAFQNMFPMKRLLTSLTIFLLSLAPTRIFAFSPAYASASMSGSIVWTIPSQNSLSWVMHESTRIHVDSLLGNASWGTNDDGTIWVSAQQGVPYSYIDISIIKSITLSVVNNAPPESGVACFSIGALSAQSIFSQVSLNDSYSYAYADQDVFDFGMSGASMRINITPYGGTLVNSGNTTNFGPGEPITSMLSFTCPEFRTSLLGGCSAEYRLSGDFSLSATCAANSVPEIPTVFTLAVFVFVFVVFLSDKGNTKHLKRI
jgi:hypothetical protein